MKTTSEFIEITWSNKNNMMLRMKRLRVVPFTHISPWKILLLTVYVKLEEKNEAIERKLYFESCECNVTIAIYKLLINDQLFLLFSEQYIHEYKRTNFSCHTFQPFRQKSMMIQKKILSKKQVAEKCSRFVTPFDVTLSRLCSMRKMVVLELT
ncbi:CLUMA_CG000561, isoform A [Clunio marinus]|uniref:CLUMA_CG000561, isoform A n=1 Tax=Clunio marinus TaxID=568069 RepID=A0A1J1HFF8_9DIPT|nr:CLUMA_CG000561, isoform A [Clunio marinus]